MLKKICGKSFLFSLLLSLNACNVPVPDVPVCVEFAPTSGGCVKIISGESFKVDEDTLYLGKTWWVMRPDMILVPSASWAEIKKFINDICKKTNQCQKQVGNWQRAITNIDLERSKK